MSKIDFTEPTLSPKQFEQRCRKLAMNFGEMLTLNAGDIFLNPTFADAVATMSLAGRATEMIDRNRGPAHAVLPLCNITEDVHVWIGFRERWTRNQKKSNYIFEDGGFTLHIGRMGERIKPQVLRSEWVGRRSSQFVNQAGHPHWQFDALETARLYVQAESKRFDEYESAGGVIEFQQITPSDGSRDMLLRLTVENMHLASAAMWWRPDAPVATAPATVEELDRWILGCVNYMRQEAGRCQIASAVL